MYIMSLNIAETMQVYNESLQHAHAIIRKNMALGKLLHRSWGTLMQYVG